MQNNLWLQANQIHLYPRNEDQALIQCLAQRLHLKETEIILGNGSNELIELVVRHHIQRGDKAMKPKPGFVPYLSAVQRSGGEMIEIPQKQDGNYDLSAFWSNWSPASN